MQGAPAYVLASRTRAVMPRLVCAVAQSLGIPTFDIEPLPMNDWPGHWRPTADQLLVLDSVAVELFKRRFGFDERALHVVGMPRMDRLRSEIGAQALDALRASLGLADASKRIVTVITRNGQTDIYQEIVRITLEAVAGIPGVSVIVKAHPKEKETDLAAYRAVIERYGSGSDTRILTDVSPYSLMAVSALGVTHFSTLGFEGALLGCPVLAVQIGEEDWPIAQTLGGLHIEARTEQEAKATIRDFIQGGEARRAFEEKLTAYRTENPQMFDGGAIARIVAICERCAGKN